MSTIRVNTIQSTSTTNGGISIDSSGHVTLDGQKLPSAGPLSNRNLIINGAMQVAQRGTSITTDGYTALDRYYIYGDGTSTKTQESLSSGEPYNQGFRHFLRVTNTSVSSLTGGYKSIYQPVEAQNVAQSGWNYTSSSSYITLSFWVRSSVSQEFFGSIQTHDGTAQKYPFSLGTLAADTWTKVTKTIPGNSNIQVDNDTGIGLFVNIAPFWGTNYTDSSVSVDTWAAYSGSTRFPDFTSTWGTTNNATFDVTGVQLEVGSVATPFEHRSFGDELAKCQRYYYAFYRRGASSDGALALPGLASLYDTNKPYTNISFPVTMRTGPSVETPNRTDAYAYPVYNSSHYAPTVTLIHGHPNGCTLHSTMTTSNTGGRASNGYLNTANWVEGDVLAFAAEL